MIEKKKKREKTWYFNSLSLFISGMPFIHLVKGL